MLITKAISAFKAGRVGVRLLSAVPKDVSSTTPTLSHGTATPSLLFDPTPEHRLLRETVRRFVESEVEPQANEFNKHERFNVALFRKLGDLGLLGITADTQYGGSGMDAVAAVIVHEELSAADPAFCLSYLAHSMLFVNNLSVNGSHAQKSKYLPATCSGEKVAGMCMSEPGAPPYLSYYIAYYIAPILSPIYAARAARCASLPILSFTSVPLARLPPSPLPISYLTPPPPPHSSHATMGQAPGRTYSA